MIEKIKKVNYGLLAIILLSITMYSVVFFSKRDYSYLTWELIKLKGLNHYGYLKSSYKVDGECPLPRMALDSSINSFNNLYYQSSIAFSGYWNKLFDKEEDNLNYIISRIQKQSNNRLFVPDSTSRNIVFLNALNHLYDSLALHNFDSVRISKFRFYPKESRLIGIWNLDTLNKHYYNIFFGKKILSEQTLNFHIIADKMVFKGKINFDLPEGINYETINCNKTFDNYFNQVYEASFKEFYSNGGYFYDGYLLTLKEAIQFFNTESKSDRFKISMGDIELKGVTIFIFIPAGIFWIFLFCIAHLKQIPKAYWLSEEATSISFIPTYDDILSKIMTFVLILVVPNVPPVIGLISFNKSNIELSNLETRTLIFALIFSIAIFIASINLYSRFFEIYKLKEEQLS